jgi:hypothetical protein
MRIDQAIQHLPPYIDCILDMDNCKNRAEAIEKAMKSRGYRKITPEEYAVALETNQENIFIWKRINELQGNKDDQGRNLPSVSSIDILDTENLVLLMQDTSNTTSKARQSTTESLHLSRVDTDEWPTPKGVKLSRARQIGNRYSDCDCAQCQKEKCLHELAAFVHDRSR